MGPGSQDNLRQHQQQLLLRSHALRLRLGQQAQVLEKPLAVADKARQGYAWLTAHPRWVAGALIVAALLRPKRAVGLGLKLWWGWRTWRRVRTLLLRQAPWNPLAR